jgi:hypothetical protein
MQMHKKCASFLRLISTEIFKNLNLQPPPFNGDFSLEKMLSLMVWLVITKVCCTFLGEDNTTQARTQIVPSNRVISSLLSHKIIFSFLGDPKFFPVKKLNKIVA